MNRRLSLFLATLFLIALAGCKATEPANDTAQVRVLHASPETEAILLKVASGDTKISSVATGATSGHATLSAAVTTYEIRSAVDNTLLSTRTTLLNGGSNYTLIVSGRRAALGFSFIEEDTFTAGAGNFRFRVANVANIGAVDLYLVAQTADVPASAVTFPGIGSNGTSVYTELAAGSFQIVLTASGTKDVVYEGAKQTFAAGASYTLAVVPGKSAKLANLTLLTDGKGGTAIAVPNLRSRVRAVQASPDAPLLAFNNNGVNMFSNVPYTANSSYVSSVSGARTMTIMTNVGGTLTTVDTTNVTLAGGEDYTLVSADKFATIDLVSLPDNNLPPLAAKTRVRFLNMSQDAGAVDVLVNFSKTFSNVAFKSASDYAELDAGTYTLGFNASSSSAAIASTAETLLEVGRIYTVVLMGPVATPATVIITDN